MSAIACGSSSERRWGRVRRGADKAAACVVTGCLLMFPVSARPETNTTYTYDALGRLISAVYTDGVATKTVTYSYDAAGNRVSVAVK